MGMVFILIWVLPSLWSFTVCPPNTPKRSLQTILTLPGFGPLANWPRGVKNSRHLATALDQISVHGISGGALRLYKRAVFCRAKALLLPQFATIERREPARNDAKEAPESAQAFFAQAENALAAITGRTFITVEAI